MPFFNFKILRLAVVDPSRGNWFHISQLTSMVAIDLQKPYAKMEVGESYTCMMFIDSRW